MGLAKSLRKINYLSGLANSLNDIASMLEEQKKKEDREKFFKFASDLYNQYKKRQEEIVAQDRELKEGGTIDNILSPENFIGIGGERPTGLNLTVNIPEEVSSKLPIEPPPIQTKEVTPYEKYNRSQKNLYDFINAIAPQMLNQNLDEATLSRANILTNLAQSQTKSLAPKETSYFDLSQGETRYAIDPYTKKVFAVATNIQPTKNYIEEYERDKNGKVKIYTVGGRNYYRKVKKDQFGNIVDEQLSIIPNDNSGKGSGNKKEDALPPTVAELIADLKNLSPYQYNKDGEKVPIPPQNLKFAKDKVLERIKLELLSPRTYQFVNNIERLWREGDPSGTREYLSPKELYNEIIKHAQAGRLTEKEQEELANYLRYYSQDIYDGLTTSPTIQEQEKLFE